MFQCAILCLVVTACYVVANEISDGTPAKCILPPFPKNGFYTIREESSKRPTAETHSGPVLRSRLRLEYTCRQGYRLIGPTSTSCYNGFWTHTDQPKCLTQCILNRNPSVNYHCFPNNSTSLADAYLCDELVDEDMTVRPQCRSPFYYHTGDLADMRCKDGTWSYVATCTPDCGVITPNRELAKQPANHGSTPWHVGVYFKLKDPYLQICGGSIISSEVVISAAHCFWGEVKRQRPASDFAVAAGKLYRHWNSQLDRNAQKSDVSEIRLPARFSGLETNYRDDIAALKVATPFQFGTYVRPVCIDFDYDFEKSQLTIGKTGKIASWGRSAQDGLEDHWQFLQEVKLPFISDEQCLMESPPGIREYITADKFCAYYNDTARELCQGDTGGGLVFPAYSRGNERYFLRGVASAARGDKQYCVTFTTFTQVTKHAQFIKEYYSPKIDKCVLPPFPDNGTYTSDKLNDTKPGEAYDTVNISITCQQGYAVDGPISIHCYNGLWSDQLPRCVARCHVAPHYSVEYLCLMPGGELRACNEYELAGTVVRPRCRSPEYYSTAELDDMRCIDGNWTYVPKCSPECAFYTKLDEDFTLNFKNVRHGEMPWHASIYDKTQTPIMQICGATLISNRALVSAAQCFYGLKVARRPAVDFAVGIGKLYRPWKQSSKDRYAQQSDVKELHLPASFDGIKANFQDDIAVVIVSVPFNYTAYVRPVCLDFNANFNRRHMQPGAVGKVAGWGITSDNDNSSQVLIYLNLPYVNIESCKSRSRKDDLDLITSDKICGGYTSVSVPRPAVCRGDNGGGWVFPERHGDKYRFFLRGILSSALRSGINNPCHYQAYRFFTAIQYHEQFIKRFWQEGERYQYIPPIESEPEDAKTGWGSLFTRFNE